MCPFSAVQFFREVLNIDMAILLQHNHSLNNILKFPHITTIFIIHEGPHGLFGKTFYISHGSSYLNVQENN